MLADVYVLWLGLKNVVSCALASRCRSNQLSLVLHSPLTGRAQGTVLSFEIALLETPETNKRNPTSAGSMHPPIVHLALYLPGVCTNVQSFTVGEEKEEAWRERKISENETCAFILFFLRAVLFPPLIFFLAAGRWTFNADLSHLSWNCFLILAGNKLQLLVSNISWKKMNQIRSIKFYLLDSLVPLPLNGRNQSKDVLV